MRFGSLAHNVKHFPQLINFKIHADDGNVLTENNPLYR